MRHPLIRSLTVPLLLAMVSLIGGCSRGPDMSAIETDAHGCQCQKCGGKFFTSKKEFLEGKCPKCGEDSLAEITGYWCEKDQHLTISTRLVSSAASIKCEKCGTPLRGKMMAPKEKDLVAWGAVKTAGIKAP